MVKKMVVFIIVFLAMFGLGVLFAEGQQESGDSIEKFPESPVSIIVGFGGGGSTDLATRIVAKGMSEYLGVPVLVDNIPGAGGAIALGELWKAKPNGYVLCHGSLSNLGVMPEAVQEMPFDSLEFEYVGRFLDYAGMIWSSTKAPWKSFDELVAWGKANPGELVYAAEEMFGINPLGVYKLFECADADIEYNQMVTSGSGETVKNVIARDADFCYISVIPVMEHYKAGLMQPLLSMAPYPMPGFEDVPVATEKFSDCYTRAYMDSCGLVAPPGTPEPIRQKLENALKYAIENEDIQKQLRNVGAVTYFLPGEDFKEWVVGMRDDIKTAVEVLKEERGE